MSKSAGIVQFLKLSAQCPHIINYWVYGNLFVERIIIVRVYNYFYFSKLFDKSTLSGSM